VWICKIFREWFLPCKIVIVISTLLKFCSFSINENQAENSFGDVSDKVVADFGCGCGTLGVAAALLNAE